MLPAKADPGRGLGDLRGAVLRHDLDRLLAAARGRRRAAAGVRHRDRADLPGAGAEPQGPPERADLGAAVHLAQHRGDPHGVRAGRGADAGRTTPQTTATSGQLRNDAETIPGIRLLDPSRVSDTFRQLEQIRQYYAFPDSLDVDRYTLNGKSRRHRRSRSASSTSTASRPGQRNWLNDHTIYTHGFGVVAAYGNQRTDDGKPVFFEGDIPPTGALTITQPRIYFGEQSPDFSIVGAPPGAAPRELDYPDSSASGQQNTTYTGDGGVKHRVVRPAGWPTRSSTRTRTSCCPTRSTRTARSSTTASRASGCEKVAPWLTLDGDPYPAVIDGKVAVDRRRLHDDERTTRTRRMTTLNGATSDSLTATTTSVVALGAAERQLHPELGEGDGRRLHRQGHALRVGRRPTRC